MTVAHRLHVLLVLRVSIHRVVPRRVVTAAPDRILTLASHHAPRVPRVKAIMTPTRRLLVNLVNQARLLQLV